MSIDSAWIKARLTGKRGEKARLAEALGIGQPDVTKLLDGTRRVQAKEIDALLAFFGEPGFTEEERGFIQLLRDASPQMRAAARAVLHVPDEAGSGEAAKVDREKDGG